MKFSVFYFSGTGNTKWAATELKNSVIKKGHQCEIYSIEVEIVNLKEIVSGSDIIGFAFPIYGANIPNIMKKYIDQFKEILNASINKSCIMLTTVGYIDAFGPFIAEKLLKRNGLSLVGYVSIKMSNNISTPKVKASFLESKEMNKRMEKGKEKIQKLINEITDNKKYIRNIGLYLIPGIIIRRAAKNAINDNYLSLSIDKEKCIKCMLCIKNCPTKSIVFSEDKIDFLPSCTACMRCYNFCPVCAICHEGKYADPKIYKRYKGPLSN